MTTACWAEDLRGHDKLRLLVIEPSVTAKGQDRRFRCPVPECTYVGATLGHAGDCLKHLKDTKHDPVGHAEFWRNTFVCFKNADGKGLLNTRPCYDSGPFAFTEPGDDRPQVAYTKVCAQVLLTFLHMQPATCKTPPLPAAGGFVLLVFKRSLTCGPDMLVLS